LRGDMVEVFKIVNDIYDGKVAPTLYYNYTSVTRGIKFKLHSQTFTHNFYLSHCYSIAWDRL